LDPPVLINIEMKAEAKVRIMICESFVWYL